VKSFIKNAEVEWSALMPMQFILPQDV